MASFAARSRALLAVLGSGLVAATALYPSIAAPSDVVTSAAAAFGQPVGWTPTAGRSAVDAAARVTGRATDLPPAAYAAVERGGGVAVAGGGRCPAGDLVVSYDVPGHGYTRGAYVTPLGPAPDDTATDVNGIVLCRGSHYAYAGFDAHFAYGRWQVVPVPDQGSEDDDANDADTAPAPKPVSPASPIAGLVDGADIEGYAPYEGQSTCDPTPKPGALALRDLLLARYPSTGTAGISRACSVGGRSEHKEGRAFDWSANVGNPTQRASVEAFVSALFATDSYGHRHALARRMGVMYVIWNHRIWAAYRADAGWRPYSGVSPHTDHMHISLSWAGARGQTSFWSGTVVPGLPSVPVASRTSMRTTRTTRTYAGAAPVRHRQPRWTPRPPATTDPDRKRTWQRPPDTTRDGSRDSRRDRTRNRDGDGTTRTRWDGTRHRRR